MTFFDYFIIWALAGFVSPVIVTPWAHMLGLIHRMGIEVSIKGIWKMRDREGTMSAAAAVVFGVIGLLVNGLLFNPFWGTLLFRRLPTHPTFSQRVQASAQKGQRRGILWADRINRIWPGHIEY